VKVDELDYELPAELIAHYPSAERDQSRLLVVTPDRLEDRVAFDLAELVPAGALCVVNDSRVIPARLFGRKSGTGGRVELLLVERLGGVGLAAAGGDAKSASHRPEAADAPRVQRWLAMARPARRLGAGTQIEIGGRLVAEVESRDREPGLWSVRLSARGGEAVDAAIEAAGHMPLPPYIRRDDEPLDRERYQTVYARVPGAVAAPTAGLHLSQRLLDRFHSRGIELGRITLHVGPGTFRPVSVADLDDHPMHAERFVIPEPTAEAIARARDRGAPVIAVGTTVVRALESAADPSRPGQVRAVAAETRLLIQPGYRFAVVDGLVTNFHLPGSTLLALVYGFGGVERVRAAYRAAVERGYRFYSYGDAMYLPRRAEGAAP
jgi:S-adenosylmethionine:tRNA ribosyltransferase-isomerase